MSFTRTFRYFHSSLVRAVDFILPPRCLISGEIVAHSGTFAPAAWGQLDFITAPLCACCGYPFAFAVAEKTLCADCLTEMPPYATARAALAYGGAARDLVLRFKHADHLHAVPGFTPLLARVGSEMLAEADYLVPVPLHRWRLLRRRYNQAALLSKALARYSGVPALLAGLIRTRATPVQGHLGYKDRHANVKNAFSVNPRYDLTGKTVILIDDVYTTGATATACSKALLKAGAARVHVLALTRVVRPEV